MKFFLSDIKEKGIKTLIILTHVDKLNHYKENDKLTLIE
jgi:GTP-binding protein EngB required for normal cell division